MIRVLSIEELSKMTKEEFVVAWKEGTVHASAYEELGYEWQPENEDEVIVWSI